MVLILFVVSFIGLVFSSLRPKLIGNPFQVFFFIWFVIFISYITYQEHFYIVSNQLVLLFSFILIVWILSLLVFLTYGGKNLESSTEIQFPVLNKKILNIFLIVTISLLPAVYFKATTMTEGNPVFSTIGFMHLRQSLRGGGYGHLAFLFPLSIVVTTVCYCDMLRDKIYSKGVSTKVTFIISLIVSLSYCILSTGRTYTLMLIVSMLFVRVPLKKLTATNVVVVFCAVVVLFVITAMLASKNNVSVEASLIDNIVSFFTGISEYTVAPFLALDNLTHTNLTHGFGIYSFRFFYAVADAIFGTDTATPTVREFVNVPMETNVYTVYGLYFRDFSFYGILIFTFVQISFHVYLYVKSILKGGIYIFLYGFSLYPLVMVFFQDQYLSILSMWIQILIYTRLCCLNRWN